jgi:hypothetical protein
LWNVVVAGSNWLFSMVVGRMTHKAGEVNLAAAISSSSRSERAKVEMEGTRKAERRKRGRRERELGRFDEALEDHAVVEEWF